jgi:tetratricopeptide (TPR) repeat protein
MLYNWGYSSYYNPYYGVAAPALVGQPVVYDYSQPISVQSPPPDETVVNPALTTFDQGREAFQQGDYTRALELTDQALRQLPNDTTLHEFRALCLFALGRYDEAAAALYAVLSVGPGWDWTTLISLYTDTERYTLQLRALESYCTQNPRSAAGRFVLAYHYLTAGHSEQALDQLKVVVALQPKDTLSAQLMQQLERQQNSASTTLAAQNPTAPPSTGPLGVPVSTPAGREGRLEGTWTAQPSNDTTITLTLGEQGHFIWKVTQNGHDRQIEGNSSFANGILTLAQDQNNALVGDINWQDDSHFQFKAVGGGPSDPGLSFTKSS